MKTTLFIAAAVCLALAGVFRYLCAGYGMSALVCLFLAGCFCFFGVLHGRTELIHRRLRVAALAILVVGFCCFFAAELPILAGSRSDKNTSADYLIVMGAGVNGATPSLSMLDRLNAAAVWLAESPNAAVVVSGSQGGGEDISEAQAMYDWLTAHGVEPSRILLEERATSSYENLVYSLALIDASGGDAEGRIALLSSDYHLCRLRYMAEKLGFQAVCVAAETSHFTLYLNYAVREALALWKCWVFGIA